jgi:hypothetical protein
MAYTSTATDVAFIDRPAGSSAGCCGDAAAFAIAGKHSATEKAARIVHAIGVKRICQAVGW